MKIEFYSTRCCEACNDVLNVYMEKCPMCGKEDAKVNVYGEEIWEYLDYADVVACEECGAEFRCLNPGEWRDLEFERVQSENSDNSPLSVKGRSY